MPQRSGHCKNQFNSQTSLNVFVKVCCLFASATYIPSFGEACCLFAPATYNPSFGDEGADLIALCKLDVGEHNFILWITRLHSWWARKVSGGSRRGTWGVLGGYLGSFLWYIFLILFSFAGIFVSESKGAYLAFFKILIISFVLCVKARYAFCHVFVFFWDLKMDLLKNVVFPWREQHFGLRAPLGSTSPPKGASLISERVQKVIKIHLGIVMFLKMRFSWSRGCRNPFFWPKKGRVLSPRAPFGRPSFN